MGRGEVMRHDIESGPSSVSFLIRLCSLDDPVNDSH